MGPDFDWTPRHIHLPGSCNVGENPAIVVGNAQPDLLKWVEEQRLVEPLNGEKPRLYVAAKHEAQGILEGLMELGLA